MKKKKGGIIKDDGANKFEDAVLATPDVSAGYCKGIQALKSNSTLLQVPDTRRLQGSVDIDENTKTLYPESSRWDYTVGYGDRAYFVEVHPACTSNVAEMINKAIWLENWLKNKAPELGKIRVSQLCWIPSCKVAISKTSTQYRNLALHKIALTKTPFEKE